VPVRLIANLIALSFLFAVQALADDDQIQIFIIHENGDRESSYVADYMSNYLSLLPQVDGDTIEIRGRADYCQSHSAEYSTNVEIAQGLFDLLQDFSKAKVFDCDDSTIEFHFKDKGSWYIVERHDYTINQGPAKVQAVRLKISRPKKVSLSEGKAVAEGRLISKFIMPWQTKKFFLPYSYALIGVYGVGDYWRLDFAGNSYNHGKFLSVGEKTVVDSFTGELVREYNIELLGS